jgi:progranulin
VLVQHSRDEIYVAVPATKLRWKRGRVRSHQTCFRPPSHLNRDHQLTTNLHSSTTTVSSSRLLRDNNCHTDAISHTCTISNWTSRKVLRIRALDCIDISISLPVSAEDRPRSVCASSIRHRDSTMLLLPSLYALPPSLLLLISCLSSSANSLSLKDEHDLANEAILKREADIQQRLQWQRPSAVRKMSSDPSEKFLLDYWIFDNTPELFLNGSSEGVLQNSMRPHSAALGNRYMPRYLDPRGLTILFRRNFECPSGSRACTSINRPNSCCSTDASCQLIQDNGFGDVGCCPSGETCGNSLSGCGSGAVSCQGGGCCLAGYQCVQNGCLQASTTTIVVAPPTSSSSPAQPTTITVTAVQTISQSNGPPETVTTTVVVTATTTEEPEEPATTSTTRSTSEEESSSSSGLQPPVGPTSGDVVTTTAESTMIPPGDACPTGFYGCSAVHQGGCCQTGANCDTTSCSAIQSTTVVDTNGVTAVAPTGVEATGAAEGRTCAGGWFSCPASVSGGCCPTGYGCAVSSCTATAAPDGGSHPLGKQAPEGSATKIGGKDWMFLLLASCTSSMILAMAVF